MSDYDRLLDSIMYSSKRKESDTKIVKRGGIGFCGLLAIVFITLKLAEVGAVANWSWWWVLSPLWIPAAIVVVLFVLLLAICVFAN